jgi:minor extracellular protease Epr
MASRQMTQRYLVLPPKKASQALAKTAGAGAHAPPRIKGVRVVAVAPVDGTELVELRPQMLDGLRQRLPGTKIVPQRFYELQRTGVPKLKRRTQTVVSQAQGRWMTVQVVTDDAARNPLADVRVTALIDARRAYGDEALTNAKGEAKLFLGPKDVLIEELHLDPLHGGWPRLVTKVDAQDRFTAVVSPLDEAAQDARGIVYGGSKASDGRGVRVAVLDTGVGPHKALKVTLGRNATGAEDAKLFRDWDGHGTHVAGVIAATADAPRAGEGPAVTLHAYRIFAKDAPGADNFAIRSAILSAVEDGCDIINLSIGGGAADPAVSTAIEEAWKNGCVCVAAAGNDGAPRVDYPARHRFAVAVSAMGLEGSWPTGAKQQRWISTDRGRAIGGKKSFRAAFSNYGTQIKLTAPGVGIVSTIFNHRWGVMDGTSMASPIAAGVLARRLAATPEVLSAPRDAQRSRAIVELAVNNASDLSLPESMQGSGLAR